MRDFLNQTLEVGDRAIIGTATGYSRGFHVVEVLGFSEKKVRITSPYSRSRGKKIHHAYPNQLVKILPEQLTWYAISK